LNGHQTLDRGPMQNSNQNGFNRENPLVYRDPFQEKNAKLSAQIFSRRMPIIGKVWQERTQKGIRFGADVWFEKRIWKREFRHTAALNMRPEKGKGQVKRGLLITPRRAKARKGGQNKGADPGNIRNGKSRILMSQRTDGFAAARKAAPLQVLGDGTQAQIVPLPRLAKQLGKQKGLRTRTRSRQSQTEPAQLRGKKKPKNL